MYFNIMGIMRKANIIMITVTILIYSKKAQYAIRITK